MQTNIFLEIRAHVKANPYCLGSLFPTSKQKGNEIYFDAPSYNSWSYNVTKGIVKDFRASERQNIIDVYQKLNGYVTPYEAARDMASKLNVAKQRDVCESKKNNLATSLNIIKPIKKSNPNIIKLINKIWSEGLPLGDSIAEQYLRNRRITLPFSNTIKGQALRFHPSLYHSETKEVHPAMLAAIYDNEGKLAAIQRTYLDNDGNKLDVSKNKMLLGTHATYAVKINVVGSKDIGVCEGIESGLSIVQEKRVTTWCALTAGNLARLVLPKKEEYEKVVAYPDIDESKVGIKACLSLMFRN